MNALTRETDDCIVVIEAIARLFSMTPQQIQNQIEAREAARKIRVRKHNSKFDAAMDRMTDIQGVVVDRYECRGAKKSGKIMQYKSGKIAVMMMHSQIWCQHRGCMKNKTIIVYPDGTAGETFERTITVSQRF